MSLTLGQNVAASEQYEAERAKEVLQLAGFGERLNKLKKGLETVVYPEYEQDGVSFFRRRRAEDCDRKGDL